MAQRNYKRILFITQWQWEDALVQTYTLPYVRIVKGITGCYSYVVTVNKNVSSFHVKKIKDVVSVQMPSGKRLFFLGWLLNILTLKKITDKKGIQYLHPWCTSAGAMGAILKWLNKKLFLTIDSFEPHAEAMVENKTWSRHGMKFKALFYFEKLEAKTADKLIFAAKGMEKYISEKYKVEAKNYYVKPACIDLNAFSWNSVKVKELVDKYQLSDKVTCVYAGKFGGIYLEDETFAFVKECENYWGADKFRFLLLSGESDEYIKEKCNKFKVQTSTVIKLFVPHTEVPKHMGLADFALCPVKPVPTKRYSTPIKDGEYWALGLPVVITPGISTDSDIIEKNNAGVILKGFSKEDYINAIKQIEAFTGKSREEVYNMIRPLAEKYRNFKIAEDVYSSIYK